MLEDSDIVIETIFMKDEHLFARVFLIDAIDCLEFFNRDRMIPNRFYKSDSRHSVGVLLSGYIGINPTTAIVAVIAPKRETFRAEPLYEGSIEGSKRLVANEKGFCLSCTDFQLFVFHENNPPNYYS